MQESNAYNVGRMPYCAAAILGKSYSPGASAQQQELLCSSLYDGNPDGKKFPADGQNCPCTTYHSGLPLSSISKGSLGTSAARGRETYDRIKRLLDFFGAVFLIFLFAPLLLLFACAIKLESPGPVFFRQDREGLRRCRFRIMKLRTMYVDRGDLTGIAHTVPGDPRVTRTGAFLRKTSLDELPQIFNILLGDMSFIGPRPHVPDMLVSGIRYDILVPYYHHRHEVKPGLTGWAQANGLRGFAATKSQAFQRIDHDLAYVQNRTFLLDLRIVLMTIRREFMTGSGI